MHQDILSSIRTDTDEVARMCDNVVMSDSTRAEHLIKKMRCCHGKSILSKTKYMAYLLATGKDNNEEDCVNISIIASFLKLMEENIKRAEMSVYSHRNASHNNNTSSKNTKSLSSERDTTEISINVPSSEQNFEVTEGKFVSDSSKSDRPLNFIKTSNTHHTKGGTHFDSDRFSEFINQLESDDYKQELARLDKDESNHNAENLDVTKPTLVLFWGSWCSASQQYYPKWTKLKEYLNKNYKDLQVLDIDCKRNDKKVTDNLMKINVNSLPTIGVFKDKKVNLFNSLNRNGEQSLHNFLKST